MNLIDRAKNILLHPKAEWPVIEQEQTGPGRLYRGYIAILALIPVVAGLVGRPQLPGAHAGGPAGALGSTVAGYLLGLAMVYVIAFIADTLAPSFDGQKNIVQALKLTAYALTASWVAGAFVVVPVLGGLVALLGTLYSLYLFNLGVPVLMKVPGRKAIGYTVVVVLLVIVAGALIGVIFSALFGSGPAAAHR
jgi:small-conductance mechanosensitive channel